ncbi:stage II sporulation protein R [Clostridium thermopalmarium]|uniref:Stage II sporulation protein R n=1 Tax=Clostridium thermopalmarium DSM 5974 TaxID=1121340 RepID=A0A2T0AP72_9CLOT|nr:stage II sporulation protein R [Clostridium thermopalmarium]PRR70805.1 Stage II sporulation protein R [Clostridium thermopalmarium DSM 5974]PVZ28729.1 stage II sporulation protein R [Clostridium thermopalmarium DSM 5974]
MKKIIAIMSFLTLLLGIILGVSYMRADASQKTIANKLIRFHVIANSDTTEDQALKLKVRDEVLKYIAPKLKEAKNINDSREILKANDEIIKEIAKKVVKENGYTYTINTSLSHENFPVKSYGNVTLPEGNYEAYRIIIGNGEGHNWWCIMFPPLCFIDVTRGQIAYDETEKEMKSVLTEDEYKLVNNQDEDIESNQIRFKYKIVEDIKSIYRKIQKH